MTKTRSWYTLIAIVLLFVLSIILISCDRHLQPQGNQFTVGILQHGSSIPLIIAKQDNLFSKHGLNVTFKTLTPAEHMPALLRGEVQVLSASSFPVILSTAQQNPQAILAYMTGGEDEHGDIIYGLVVSKSSNISSLRDLVGKSIGSASKFTVVNLRNVLGAKLGDRTGKTSIREISDKGALLDALRRGTVDAVVLDQPALSSKEIMNEFKIIEPNFRAKYFGSPYWSGSGVARREWVNANKKQFDAYLSAIDEALVICKQNPERAKRTFISYFGISDLQPDRIGMYVYPNAQFAPSPDFVKELAADLVSNGMLLPNHNFSELFYR